MANVSSSNSQEANVPKLRFPGFEGEYSCKKLGQICEKVIRNDPESNAPIMMLSAASGFIYQSEKYSRENAGKSLKKYTLLKAGELAFNHGASKIKKYGCCYELTVPEARIPYVYHTFKIIDEDCHIPYIAQLLNNPLIDNQLKRLVSSSVRLDGLLNISYNEYMTISLNLPQKDEQEKIEKFLALLNQRIVKQQQLINALKLYKRGALSRLFPKRGSRVPEYRFAGFTDDWEQRKLVEICDYVDYRGKTPPKVDNGIFLVTAKNVKDGYIDYESSKEFISEDDYEEVMHRGKPEIGDVLITTEAPCGNVAQVNACNIALAQRIIKYRGHKNVIDNTFLKHYMLAPFFQKVLLEKSSGGTVQGIKGSILHQQCVIYPVYGEQVKIGQYFDNLDTLITLHQRKLDKYKSIKQGLLEKLFI